MGRDGRGLWGLGRVNDGVVRRVLEADSRQEYTLDTDATVIESEKEEAQWTYQKEKGYQSLVGFLFEAGLVLHDEFRDGNMPAGAGAVPFLKGCRQRMPRGKSYANAVFFRLRVLAYNLFLALKILGLPTEWRSYTIGTVRWRLYQVACRVVHHARRVVLKMATTIEKVALIRGGPSALLGGRL